MATQRTNTALGPAGVIVYNDTARDDQDRLRRINRHYFDPKTGERVDLPSFTLIDGVFTPDAPAGGGDDAPDGS